MDTGEGDQVRHDVEATGPDVLQQEEHVGYHHLFANPANLVFLSQAIQYDYDDTGRRITPLVNTEQVVTLATRSLEALGLAYAFHKLVKGLHDEGQTVTPAHLVQFALHELPKRFQEHAAMNVVEASVAALALPAIRRFLIMHALDAREQREAEIERYVLMRMGVPEEEVRLAQVYLQSLVDHYIPADLYQALEHHAFQYTMDTGRLISPRSVALAEAGTRMAARLAQEQ